MRLILSAVSRFVGQLNIPLDVGWHTLIFLKQADGDIIVEHKPFIDKLLINKWLGKNYLNKSVADATYGNTLVEQRLEDGVFGVELQSPNGTTLSSVSWDLSTNDWFTNNVAFLDALPFSVFNTLGATPRPWQFKELATTNPFTLESDKYLYFPAATSPSGTGSTVEKELHSDGTKQEYYLWNKIYHDYKFTNASFPGGSLTINTGHVYTVDTRTEPWTITHVNGIKYEDLTKDVQDRIGSGGGGTDLSQLPFASHNKGIDLTEFVAEPLKANISLQNKTKAALTPGDGADVNEVSIQLAIENTYQIWNRANHSVKLVDNKFPGGSFTILPAHIYSFKIMNDVWVIKNVVTINADELSDELKAKLAVPTQVITPDRLFLYWNDFQDTEEMGNRTFYAKATAGNFNVVQIGSNNLASETLNNTNRAVHRLTITDNESAAVGTNAGLSLHFGTANIQKTIFVWNQLRNKTLLVSFPQVTTNNTELFGTDFITNHNELEPGDCRMFFVTRQGNSWNISDSKIFYPFNLTPHLIGYKSINTSNINDNAVTTQKIPTGHIVLSKLSTNVQKMLPRFAELFCRAIKDDGSDVTATEWLAITGTWEVPGGVSRKLMRVSTFGEHYDMEAVYNVSLFSGPDDPGVVWAWQDPVHIGSRGQGYGYKPPSNSDYVFLLKIREYANINSQSDKHLSVFIEKLGANNGVQLKTITGVYFANVTVNSTTKEITTITRADDTNILDKSQSTFNL